MHEHSLPVGDRDEQEDSVAEESTQAINREKQLRVAMMETEPMVSQTAVWAVSEQNGWHNPPCDLKTDLLLIHSEVSEATEALREGRLLMSDGKGSVEEELADIIIRVLHTAEKNGMDVFKAVQVKHDKNQQRPYRHGNKAF